MADSSSDDDEVKREELRKLKAKIKNVQLRARSPTQQQLQHMIRCENEAGEKAEAEALRRHKSVPATAGTALPAPVLQRVVHEAVALQMPTGAVEELRLQGYKCVKLPEVARPQVEAILALGDALFEADPAVKATMTVHDKAGARPGHLAEGDLGYRTARGDMFLDTRCRALFPNTQPQPRPVVSLPILRISSRLTDSGEVVPLTSATEEALPGLEEAARQCIDVLTAATRGVLEALAAELRVPAEIFLEDSALDANSAML